VKHRLGLICFCAIVLVSCNGKSTTQSPNTPEANSSTRLTQISQEQAVDIAKSQAIKEHESLEKYDIKSVDNVSSWRVEFQLKDLSMGGGVIYTIDKRTGKIIARQETQ